MFARSLLNYLPKRSFYDASSRNDTIFATATTINTNKGSPLGVIRVSGKKTQQILKNIIGERKELKPRLATLTRVLDPSNKELIDLGLVIWFPSPNSYTGEDVCELHLHGSQAIITKMLSTLGTMPGVRPAEPGEFTRRAVMNGKMSLMEAESLPDLIKSNTDNQRRLALNGLDGSTRRKYDEWTEQLVRILAHLEASIDFGEDELIGERAVVSDCIEKLKCLSSIVQSYIEASARCRDFVNDGASIAILGKPNAGKSTLMNLLSRRDLSIVSDLSGTTRDLVRHSFELNGHSVTLCDTAGLKNLNFNGNAMSDDDDTQLAKTLIEEKHNSIEQEGIRRALDAAKQADILVYLIDGTNITDEPTSLEKLYSELEKVLNVICGQESKLKLLHVVMNKLDLNVCIKSNYNNYVTQLRETITTKLERKHSVHVDISLISCKTQENFDGFLRSLTEQLDKMCSFQAATTTTAAAATATNNKLDDYNGPVQFDYVNERHLSLLRSMHRHLELASRMELETIDKMAQHVRESVDYLSRVVGSISSEEVFDVIFRDFCIGK